MADQPIVVSENAAVIDGVQAAVRYVVVLIGFGTAVLGLLKVHDVAGIIALIQSNGGNALAAVSGLIALATAAYGIFKSQKRGGQLVTAAQDPEVPETSVTLKP